MSTPKNSIVYIDGFNLYYRLKSYPKMEPTQSYKWLDIRTLMEKLVCGKHNILRVKYFTARVKSPPWDPKKDTRQDIYLQALKKSGVEIIEGKFKRRNVKGNLTRRAIDFLKKELKKQGTIISEELEEKLFWKIVEISKFEEKESDVNIATHIIQDCALNKSLEGIILISNDTDLKSPLNSAKKCFKKNVIIFSPQENIHIDLKKISTYSRLIKKDDFIASQFPIIFNELKKPESW